jgi:nicotinamide-nucleotide amidase
MLFLVKAFVLAYTNTMCIEEKVARLLLMKDKTIAVAESCTGGLLTHRLTNIPGSSKFLRLGIIVYSNESKISILKVPSSTIKRHGAVSEETATAMARSVRRIHRTDFGVGITGIAGPSGGSAAKPVGLAYIAVAEARKTICLRRLFQGSRTRIKSQAATQGLKLLYQFLI